MYKIIKILIVLNLLGFCLCRHWFKNGILTKNLKYSSYVQYAQTKWFIQKLDHFQPSNTDTWKQRYFVNDTNWDRNRDAIVFLMIGGEGEATARWIVEGEMMMLAKRYRALCFQLEHRFYGFSYPTQDSSVKNLQYLSSEQALSDLAYFIKSMNEQYKLSDKVKWISYGGSYPGSLAAWLRLKYPHLVHAAVSSSGPLIAKIDFPEYFDVVTDALTSISGSNDCVEAIKEGTLQVTNLMSTNPQQLDKTFKTCKKMKDATNNDKMNFYENLASNFAGIVQYNEDNRPYSPTYGITINTVCDIMLDKNLGKEFQRLAKINTLLQNVTSGSKCFDYDYNVMIDQMRNTTLTDNAERQWVYQTCTEFGFFQTSSSSFNDIFGNNFTVDFFLQQCQDIFGKKFDKKFIYDAARFTNIQYGGLGIKSSRIIFVHGTVDPWHKLGITHSEDDGMPAILIQGTAHCANMYQPKETDKSSLKAARSTIRKYLDTWLM